MLENEALLFVFFIVIATVIARVFTINDALGAKIEQLAEAHVWHFCVGWLAKYWSGGCRTCRTCSYGIA